VDIIKEWQAWMGADTFSTAVCAVCAWCVVPSDVADVHPDMFDLTLLCNDCLPQHVLPTTYDRSVYKNAILCARGMHSTTSTDCLSVSSVCRSALLGRKGKQPKYSLTNFCTMVMRACPSIFSLCPMLDLLLFRITRYTEAILVVMFRRNVASGSIMGMWLYFRRSLVTCVPSCLCVERISRIQFA
jgi:hypothetical protein